MKRSQILTLLVREYISILGCGMLFGPGICQILPELLAYIRMIWTLSGVHQCFDSLRDFQLCLDAKSVSVFKGFYNNENPERLTGLLRKISNEIIHRCCAKISLDEVFNGDVEGSMVDMKHPRDIVVTQS